jgi:uncharacterized RDD family membrane protein YckC
MTSDQHYGTGPVPPGAYAPPPPGPPVFAAEDFAPYGRRAFAAIIDGVIMLSLALGILAAVGAGFFSGGDVGFWDVVVGLLLLAVLLAALTVLYAPLVMVPTNGQTFGKAVTGCRVARADGRKMTFGYAVLRESLVKGLLFGLAAVLTGGLSILADYLWPLFDSQNRALHDFVVDSRVVRD